MTEREFEALWLNHHNDVFYFVLSLTRFSGLEAEDILQEVYIKAYMSIKQLKKTEKLRSWLFQIAKNKIRNELRNGHKIILCENEKLDLFINRYENMDIKLDKIIINEFILGFPKDFQYVLYLHLYCEMSSKEIADLTGMNYPALRKRLYRVKKLLAENLDSERAAIMAGN